MNNERVIYKLNFLIFTLKQGD